MRWVWILIFSGVLILSWRYMEKGALIDESELSGRLESAVDEVLSRHGVNDADIRRVSRSERRKKLPIPVLWIETTREFVLPRPAELPKIIAGIKDAAAQLKLDAGAVRAEGGGTALECGRKGQVFQRLIFSAGLPRSGPARVAIVIDDVAGRPSDLQSLDDFFSLGIPITYAVLPMEKSSRQTAAKISGHKDEIILHQPMEPEDIKHNNPGKAAFLVGMGRPEIERKLELNFRSVPGAIGVSNHMGSRFTASTRDMIYFFDAFKHLAAAVRNRNLFFFDSYTNPKSVGVSLSGKTGVRSLRNDIFLDNADDADLIVKQLQILRKEAQKNGFAAAIGHVHKKHLPDALRREIPEFRRAGIEFTRISDVIAEKYASARD